jgi:hypothetical protein
MKASRLQCAMMLAVCVALLPACDRVANTGSLAKGPAVATSTTVIQEREIKGTQTFFSFIEVE